MVNYSKGKIYKIESHLGDKIFIGSTTKEHLSQRMDTQRHNYDSWKNGTSELTTVYLVFEEYGVKNCKIILLESYPCETKDELESRKSFYVNSMNCVNKNSHEDNKKLLMPTTQNVKENIKEIKEIKREYYEKNKERINARKRERRAKLKEMNK